VTVTLAPVALSVAGRFALVATTTLPKAKSQGLQLAARHPYLCWTAGCSELDPTHCEAK